MTLAQVLDHRFSRYALYVLGWGFIVTGFATQTLILCVVAAMTAWGFARILWHREAHRDDEITANGALASLDVICDGRHYLGRESECVWQQRDMSPTWVLSVQQLCRTKNGTWFTLRFQLPHGQRRVEALRVEPISEQDAKGALERAPATYRRVFGDPAIA